MKFCMNGGILLGTLDGANIEIKEEVGDDNIYIFGAKVFEIEECRKKVRRQLGGQAVICLDVHREL